MKKASTLARVTFNILFLLYIVGNAFEVFVIPPTPLLLCAVGALAMQQDFNKDMDKNDIIIFYGSLLIFIGGFVLLIVELL